MEMNTMVAMGVTFILGMGGVAAFVAKFLPKVVRYVTIAKEAVDIADSAVKALSDNKITNDEIASLLKEVNDLKAALKK